MAMKPIILAVAAGLLACNEACADPGAARLSEFASWDGFLTGTEPIPLRTMHGLVPVLQEIPNEWGWGGGMDRSSGSGPSTAPKEVEEKTNPLEVKDERLESIRDVAEEEPKPEQKALDLFGLTKGDAPARSTRIGLEIGGFFPLGAKEEAFNTGQMAGLLLGLDLPPLVGGITITTEIRLLEGTTSSTEQGSGHDVSSFLVVLKDDYLVHFFPRRADFNLFYFLGLTLGLEMTSAERTTAAGSEEDSGTAVWFVVDTGLGAWVNLGGPIDLILRLEFNIVPVSENVSFFVVGTAGIQIRF